MPRGQPCIVLVLFCLCSAASAEEKTERFDRDPGWEARNNRVNQPARTIRQDFGYANGAIGGFITAAAEPAYCGKKLPRLSFNDVLTASGTLTCSDRGHLLIGFFNSQTINEWRTPNTIALRISPRGDVFLGWLEYATQRWRAGGDEPQSFPTHRNPDTGRQDLQGFNRQGVHRWSLRYDPQANGGRGVVTGTIDDATAICNLADGHKADGATFDRFGLINVTKSADDGGELWLKDLTINGVKEDLSRDPGWDEKGNRHKYETKNVRPWFDFGYGPTHFAAGQKPGELGGLVFRGDCRMPERMASYADRLDDLSLDKPLRASGKVCLRRGVSDSTVLLGFFHDQDSMAVNPSQDSGLPRSFLGISTDGPSREGFYFSPTYRVGGDHRGQVDANPPRIYPDGKSHEWSLVYTPTADGRGEITMTLGKQSVRLPLTKDARAAATRFNRFGLITTWVDGNGQSIYFDDLSYTWKQN